ncbi:MAG: hypothetical protein FP820_00895 [Sulfurimonas sp.]|jgi:hypothetical protein|nr:hypothetical protein [Sulfurimonas sp.]MBU1217283.1 hypothetical protein [bacterium]MBU1434069.1 hypothetical protein [bacterium]MBU1503051.1 hypothetical protein [bacterium]MBU3938800.1 hypothetical protein [bacterium]
MQTQYKTIEALKGEDVKLVEVELMLTLEELQTFGAYCIQNEIKFNDWIRKLAYDKLEEEAADT